MHHDFCTLFSLPLLHDYNVKVPNFMFFSRMGDNNFLFLLTLIKAFRIQLHKNLPIFDKLNENDGISVIKFEAARIHFLIK